MKSLKSGLRFVADMTDGYKTIIGAIGVALTGVVMVAQGAIGILHYMYPDTIDSTLEYEQAKNSVITGVGLVSGSVLGGGVGHKIEKGNAKKQEVVLKEKS